MKFDEFFFFLGGGDPTEHMSASSFHIMNLF